MGTILTMLKYATLGTRSSVKCPRFIEGSRCGVSPLDLFWQPYIERWYDGWVVARQNVVARGWVGGGWALVGARPLVAPFDALLPTNVSYQSQP